MECDVAVLGGGPGGYPAAIRAAQLGASVVLIEQGRVGGTCITVGCIPTKTWVQTAHALKEARETFAQIGVRVTDPELDFDQAQKNKTGIVDGLVNGITGVVKTNGITIVNGRGAFTGPNTIAVEGGEDVSFKSAIVFASLKRPVPLTHSTPFTFRRPATPVVICLTTPAFHALDASKSSVASPTLTPNFA